MCVVINMFAVHVFLIFVCSGAAEQLQSKYWSLNEQSINHSINFVLKQAPNNNDVMW